MGTLARRLRLHPGKDRKPEAIGCTERAVKILHVLLSAYACFPDAGSEPGVGWNWALHLAERGLKVRVLTVVEERARLEEYRSTHPTTNIEFSYVTVPTGLFKECSGMHYALWQWAALRVARKLMQTEPFDIVHHVTYGSIHVPSQLWRLGLPIVFGPVGGGQTAPPSMLSEFGRGAGKERLRTLFTKVLPYSPLHRNWIQRMSAVLVTNRDTMNLVRAMGRPQAELQFDTALPASFLAPAPRVFANESRSLRLLWVGRMLPRKALPLTLDALARADHKATLTIVGAGMREDLVWQLVQERGLTGRVNWAGGRLPWLEVREAYLSHDAMLFNSVRESTGSQLVEAMALGLPLIMLDMHGPRDLVPDGAAIKVPLTTRDGVVSGLAAAIDQFAALSAAERSDMSRVGWSFAQDLVWTKRAESAENIYRDILAKRPLFPPPSLVEDLRLSGTLHPGAALQV